MIPRQNSYENLSPQGAVNILIEALVEKWNLKLKELAEREDSVSFLDFAIMSDEIRMESDALKYAHNVLLKAGE